jgi:rare lipoprotein A
LLNRNILFFTLPLIFLVSCIGGETPEPNDPKRSTAKTRKVPIGKKYKGFGRWNGEYIDGETSAGSEIYDMKYLVASHKKFPKDTMLFVKSLEGDNNVIVRIASNEVPADDVALGLSKMSAEKLGVFGEETVLVEYKVIGYNRKFDEKHVSGEVSLPKPDEVENLEAIIKNDSKKEDDNELVITKVDLNNSIVDENLEIENNENEEEKQENNIVASLSILPPNSDLDSDNDLEVDTNSSFVEANISDSLSDFGENNISFSDQNSSLENNSTEENQTVKPKKIEYVKRFYVQLGSFQSPERAEKFMMERNQTVLPEPLKLIIRKDAGLYKLWVSGFVTEQEARQFSSEKQFFDSSFLVWREEEVIVE